MTPLSLHELLGTLVADLVRGERLAAEATVEFLRALGFVGGEEAKKEPKDDKDDWGHLRFIKFSFQIRGVDGKPTTRTIRVPLLSMLPIPLQQVDQAEYEFFLRVIDINRVKDPSEGHAEILCEIAPFTADQAPTKTIPRIRVKLAMRQADLPAGLSSSLRRIEETSGE